MSGVVILEHPLAGNCLGTLRDRETRRPAFRRALNRLSLLLAVEATRNLNVVREKVVTPLGVEASSCCVNEDRQLLIPILRAGLGFADGFLTILPGAQMGHIGIVRDHNTLEAKSYLDTVPNQLEDFEHVFLLDPMLATGNSSVRALEIITAKGCHLDRITLVCAVAAEQGIKRVQESFPRLRIITAAVDPALNERAYIVPGLGDAGDRLFL